MAMLLGAQLNTFDLDTGFFKGGRCAYVSATAISIEAAACADSTGTYRLSPSAQASVAITTIDAINGLDEKTCSATATTHGTATFEPSASIFSETCLSSTVRSLTGTNLSGAGTTITGTGTKFLSECGIGDVIRTVSKGAARITAIASDTSLTISAAFPGGNPNGDAGTNTLYENMIVRIAAETPQRVNTITHAGTSVVVGSSWTSSTSGVAIKLGGEIASCWYYPWAVYGGSSHGYILSSQRTRPYGVAGYTTAWRCVGSQRNNSSGNFVKTTSFNFGAMRVVSLDDCITDGRVIAGGTATIRTQIDCSSSVPPLAVSSQMLVYQVYSATARAVSIYATGATELSVQVTGITTTLNAVAVVPIFGQSVDYIESGAGSSLYLDVLSWVEAL